MIRLVRRHLTLAEIHDLPSVSEYEKLVRPLSYDFGLARGGVYIAIGMLTQNGTPWLYIAPASGSTELQVVPAALFQADWSDVPSGWCFSIAERGDIHLLPASLVVMEHWFERYVDGDPAVVEIVDHEIRRHRTL